MKRILLYFTPFLILIFGIIYLMPVIFVFITSLRPNELIMQRGFSFLPEYISLSNYALASSYMLPKILNSLIISIGGSLILLVLGTIAAYPLARYRVRYSNTIFMVFLAGNMLPPQLYLIPLFLIEDRLNLLNTYHGLILAHVGFQLGFTVFLLRNFLRTIPTEVEESARIDGCPELLIPFRVLLPTIKPALFSIFLLDFIWIWGDFLWAIILLESESLWPVTVALLGMQGQWTVNWGAMTAGSFISILPSLTVLLIFHRYLEEGFAKMF